MIGSSTLIINRNGKIEAHIMGGYIFEYDVIKTCAKKKLSPVDWFEIHSNEWKDSPDAANLSLEDVQKIATSATCTEGKDGYHKLCGDGIYFLDLVERTLKVWHREYKEIPAHWETYPKSSVSPVSP